jgi:DNA-binding FadR family transcriptional regulator
MKDRKNSIDLMEIRCIIEKEAAFYAAKRATEEQIRELDTIIEDTRELILDRKYRFETGLSFHMKIADMASNEILKKVLQNISEELKAQRKDLLFKHMNTDELIYELKEHIQIFNYIKDGNSYGAREAMETHLFRALKILKDSQ